jgi:hypothetical protein
VRLASTDGADGYACVAGTRGGTNQVPEHKPPSGLLRVRGNASVVSRASPWVVELATGSFALGRRGVPGSKTASPTHCDNRSPVGDQRGQSSHAPVLKNQPSLLRAGEPALFG